MTVQVAMPATPTRLAAATQVPQGTLAKHEVLAERILAL
jgi:hypothetical protein